jgi:DNA-binding SARP family transcriptional activator
MQFEILGPFRALTARGEVSIPTGRDRTVLAVLLLHAGSTVSTTMLIEAIWPTSPPGARNQLQGCVSRLRKRIADAGVTDQVILTDPGGYRVNLGPHQLDLLQFRQLVSKARNAVTADQPDRAIEQYQAALALWPGPALTGVDGDLGRHVATLDEERVQALEERIDLELAAGGSRRLVPELSDLVRQYPHRESLHRALMLALYHSDRQADALAAYRHARRLLHDELGIEPGPELQRLHQAILSRDSTLHAAPKLAPARRSSTDDLAPRELPAAVAEFTGRADALKVLDQLLDSANGAPAPAVIAAVAGTAGVGKTALAVHWAHQVTDRFPDGQLYLNLRGYTTEPPLRPVEALSLLLRSLGTAPEQIPTEEVPAAALYRTKLAQRRMLILLDNARSVDQVRPLLPGSPSCFVLVTSRDRLTGLVARDGARRIALDVLTPVETHTLLARLVGHERLEAEPDAVAGVAKACARLPLALRIAAAHLSQHPGRSLADYVAELSTGDRLVALTADGDEETAVRSAMETSYQALPVEIRRAFRLLGLVPGPDFSPAAVAAMASAPVERAARWLSHMAGAHLVEEHVAGRYTFHDLLRLYAGQLAADEDSIEECDRATSRLLDHYMYTSELAAELLYPLMTRLPVPPIDRTHQTLTFSSAADALKWLDIERSNLVTAVNHAANKHPARFTWLMASCLRGYFWRSRYNVDWMTVANAATVVADAAGDLQGQAVARHTLADAHYSASRYPEAQAHYTAAVGLAKKAGWVDGEATIHCSLGILHRALGQLPEAAEHLTAALSLPSRLPGLQSSCNTNLGVVSHELGQLERSIDHLTKALAVDRKMHSGFSEGNNLVNLGCVYYDLGRLELAREHGEAALKLHRRFGNKPGEVGTLGMLAEVHAVAGRPDDALYHARASHELATAIEDHVSKALSQMCLGNVKLSCGSLLEALDHHRHALDLARAISYRITEVHALLGLATAQLRLDDLHTASQTAEQCLHLAHRAGYRMLEGRALTCLAEIGLSQGRHEDASGNADEALYNHQTTGHRLGEARTLTVLGQIGNAAGQPMAARRHWRKALALFAEIGAPAPESLRTAVAD